jgi:hypothetical protein
MSTDRPACGAGAEAGNRPQATESSALSQLQSHQWKWFLSADLAHSANQLPGNIVSNETAQQ